MKNHIKDWSLDHLGIRKISTKYLVINPYNAKLIRQEYLFTKMMYSEI